MKNSINLRNSYEVLNRELSWMQFNERVLQEAQDERNPIIERLKFLGIYSNNLDEFFRVRVATIKRLITLKTKNTDYLDYEPKDIFDKITIEDHRQQELFSQTYDNLIDELNQNNILLVNEMQLNPEQGVFVKKYFKDNIRPILFPIMLKNLKDADVIRDSSIYLAIIMTNSKTENFAFLEVPTRQISRFLILPEHNNKQYLMLLEDVIRYCLSEIFSIFNYSSFAAYTIKITRDSELDLDNDVSKSFAERLSESLKLRKYGLPVRIVYDRDIPATLFKKIMKILGGVKANNLVSGGRYHNFKDFMEFPNFQLPNLEFSKMETLQHPDLKSQKSILNVISRKDIMIHFPYHTFQHIIDLLREASIDPQVTTIKMTIYRVAKISSVMNALINASRNGKEVVVYLELQARFNEEQNIYWLQKLQESGVKILQGIPSFKVHSKLILIKRKENRKIKLYANIGTGNFNEITAPVFSDIGLLTANQLITSEIDIVFNLFESYYKPYKFKYLLVAPFNLRKSIIQLIDNEINNAKKGLEAWAIIKLNSLVDKKTVSKLYEASNTGVKITLIIRGINVLIPNKINMSENIKAFSIVDRYLEHSRIYCFCNKGDTQLYISSADWMIRNFDNRFEVACPILDPKIKKDILTILKLNITDNYKSRTFSDNYQNIYKQDNEINIVRAQYEVYNFLKTK